MQKIYDFKLINKKGEEISLDSYKGKVILIVNSATGCGFTPQYEAIERYYELYHSKGLEIIDVPCNQFGNQTPGTDEEISNFCALKYNTQYVQMKKSDVNGENQLPLFKYLKEQCGFNGFGSGKMADTLRAVLSNIDPDYDKNNDIKWNFTKFIVDREGNVVSRFEPTIDMNDVEAKIKELL